MRKKWHAVTRHMSSAFFAGKGFSDEHMNFRGRIVQKVWDITQKIRLFHVNNELFQDPYFELFLSH